MSGNNYELFERAIREGLGEWLCAELNAYRDENLQLRGRLERMEQQLNRAVERIHVLTADSQNNFMIAEQWQGRYLNEYEAHNETQTRLRTLRHRLNQRMQNEGAWQAIQRRTERLHAAGFRTRNLLQELVGATEIMRNERLDATASETETEVSETDEEMEEFERVP